jgi:SNF2 family DNA or RNA helicase
LKREGLFNETNLMQSGISCVQLVGSMSLAARDAAIKRFAEDPDCKIFLMSLKAGGVALNLTVASHVSDSPLFSCYSVSSDAMLPNL